MPPVMVNFAPATCVIRRPISPRPFRCWATRPATGSTTACARPLPGSLRGSPAEPAGTASAAGILGRQHAHHAPKVHRVQGDGAAPDLGHILHHAFGLLQFESPAV